MRQRRTWGAVDSLAYSLSGRLLVGRHAGRVQVWDAATLEKKEVIPAGDPSEKLLDCLFRPGGQTFLRVQGYCSAEQDLPRGEPRPEHQGVLPGPEMLGGVFVRHGIEVLDAWWCFGPDGQSFVGRDPKGESVYPGLYCFDGERLRDFKRLEDRLPLADTAISPDGRFFAGANFAGAIMLADLGSEPPSSRHIPARNNVFRLAWSPTAPLLAGTAGYSVLLWDATTGERVHRFTGFRRTVQALAFSPDGRLLAAGSREGRVRVWEVPSGRERVELDYESGKVNDLAFSPDGSTAAAGCSKGVVVWDLD
jgi:hypothetical protein